MKFLIVVLLFIVACDCKPKSHTYQLSNGQVVTCSHLVYGGGTTDLSGCTDGNDYMNQINLKRINSP